MTRPPRADRRVRAGTPVAGTPVAGRNGPSPPAPRPSSASRLIPGAATVLAAVAVAAGLAGCRGGEVRRPSNPFTAVTRMIPGLRVEPDRPYTQGPPAPEDAPPPPNPVPAAPVPARHSGPVRGPYGDDRPAPYEPSGTARPVPAPRPERRGGGNGPPTRVPAPAPPADADAYYKVGSGHNPLAWAAAFGRKLGVVADGPSDGGRVHDRPAPPARLVSHRRPTGSAATGSATTGVRTAARRPTVSRRPAVRLGVPEFDPAPSAVAVATAEPLAVESPFAAADRRGRPVAHAVPVGTAGAANPFADRTVTVNPFADAPADRSVNPFADDAPPLMALGFGG